MSVEATESVGEGGDSVSCWVSVNLCTSLSDALVGPDLVHVG